MHTSSLVAAAAAQQQEKVWSSSSIRCCECNFYSDLHCFCVLFTTHSGTRAPNHPSKTAWAIRPSSDLDDLLSKDGLAHGASDGAIASSISSEMSSSSSNSSSRHNEATQTSTKSHISSGSGSTPSDASFMRRAGSSSSGSSINSSSSSRSSICQEQQLNTTSRRSHLEAPPSIVDINTFSRRVQLLLLTSTAATVSPLVSLVSPVTPAASASALPAFADRAWEAMGGGPSDLTFPETWVGVWDVSSILVGVETPLGEEVVPNLRPVRRAQQEDLNKQQMYQVRRFLGGAQEEKREEVRKWASSVLPFLMTASSSNSSDKSTTPGM